MFVLSTSIVRWAIEQLRSAKVHTFFPAYLEIRRTAADSGSDTDLHPSWANLEQFLQMPGGPPGKPNFRPFWHGAWKEGQDWMNANIAGSYATSSIRKVPLSVVDAQGSAYALKKDHARLALQHLLFGEPLQVVPLATFYYRDFGFTTDGPSIGPLDLITVFREDFGYTSADNAEFSILFAEAIPERTDWFEPWTPPAPEGGDGEAD